MPFWERNRALIYLAGGLLVAYLAVYLFALRPYRYERAQMQSAIAGLRNREAGQRFWPEDRPASATSLSLALKRFQHTNLELGKRYTSLEERTCRALPDPLVEEGVEQIPQYVRARWNDLREAVNRTASLRNVQFSDQAQLLLGEALPAEYNESVETDLRWLRQMAVVRDFLDLLFAQSEGPDGTRQLLAVESLRPEPGRVAGEGEYLVEYGISTRIHVSLPGLARILDACAQPETFFAIRQVEIDAAPSVRRARRRASRPQKLPDGRKQVRQWSDHYYEVNLEVARVTLKDLTTSAGAAAQKRQEAQEPAQPERPTRHQPAVY